MPSPVDALPCGSRSTISTFSPIAASAVPRLIAVVVLPTPPLWCARASTRGTMGWSLMGRGAQGYRNRSDYRYLTLGDTPHAHDPRLRVGFARDQVSLDSPRFRRL